MSELSDARIDVWLWAVRQTKTRSAATAAVRAGHVRVNNEAVKSAHKVKIGDTVRYRVDGWDRVLVVKKIIVKRVGYAVARDCYEDLTLPRPDALVAVPRRDRGTGRPTKKERRQLEAFLGRDTHEG